MNKYPFDPELLERAGSPVSERQLRKDFDFPPQAVRIELWQVRKDGPQGAYYDKIMYWEECVILKRWSMERNRYEEHPMMQPRTRRLEPSPEPYL